MLIITLPLMVGLLGTKATARKLLEDIFGWVKATVCMAKTESQDGFNITQQVFIA